MWVELDVQPLRDDDQEITGYVAVQLDITERKRILAEIERKEAQFRFIFESLPIGISMRRVEADGTPSVRLVNDAHLRICGYSREELADPGVFRRISYPEEYVRQMIHAEEVHAAEVDKMLRKPGELSAFAPRAV